MKRNLLNLSVITLATFLFASCKKTDVTPPQNLTGLTQSDISGLEAKYHGLKIDANAANASNFKSKEDVNHFIDSLNADIKRAFNKRVLSTNTIITALSTSSVVGTPIGDQGDPGNTVNCTANGINGAGYFSSFRATFQYNPNVGVTNMGLSVQGLTIGWWWNAGTTYMTGQNSGTTSGSATYFYGVFTLSYNFTLTWSYDPYTQVFTYFWSAQA